MRASLSVARVAGNSDERRAFVAAVRSVVCAAASRAVAGARGGALSEGGVQA